MEYIALAHSLRHVSCLFSYTPIFSGLNLRHFSCLLVSMSARFPSLLVVLDLDLLGDLAFCSPLLHLLCLGVFFSRLLAF